MNPGVQTVDGGGAARAAPVSPRERPGAPGIPTWLPSAIGREYFLREEGRALMTADWTGALFIHFEVDPAALQRAAAFPVDCFESRAFVSFVAFTMRDLALGMGGAAGRAVMRPVATHEFLNLRTYVRVDGEPGIQFLREWLPNRLSVMIGPPLFGLPYRWGEHGYGQPDAAGEWAGEVRDRRTGERLRYRGKLEVGELAPAESGSLDEFVLERYSAFTEWRGWRRRFRIWHPPWRVRAAMVSLEDDRLLRGLGGWAAGARLIGAHWSPGWPGVWMGRPRGVRR